MRRKPIIILILGLFLISALAYGEDPEVQPETDLPPHIAMELGASAGTAAEAPVEKALMARGGMKIETRYAVITYESPKLLKKFNDKLRMESLKYLLNQTESETVEDEVKNKIDLIVEKAEMVLEMYPSKLKFQIVLKSDTDGIADEYKRIYGPDVEYIAFYSPVERTVFYSVKHVSLAVVTHEIGHVVVETYFGVSPPVKIHEVLAQYAEMHITD